MPTITDEDSARLNQIERTLRRLQDEMEALRDEMRGTVRAATERADAARANVQATKDRAATRHPADERLSPCGRPRQASPNRRGFRTDTSG
jgi:prefoldin subunit 5